MEVGLGSALPQKVFGLGPAEMEVARLEPAARALAHSLVDGSFHCALAQTLAKFLPSATTIRVGFRTADGVLVLSSCILAQGGSPTRFFLVPNCPSAVQECLDSGLCGLYLRTDAHKPDLHVLWRDAPHTMAALCGAVPRSRYLPDAQGCAAALLVGICRGDNSLVSAQLSCLARAFAPHLPEVLAQVSKGKDACAPIPDPGSALHGLQPLSSTSHTPSSSSCHSSDNTCSGGQPFPSASNTLTWRTPGSIQSSTRSGSSGGSSSSLGHQLPVCPASVSIQEDLALWEHAGYSTGAQREPSITAVEHVGGEDIGALPGASSSSVPSSNSADRGNGMRLGARSMTADSLAGSDDQLPITNIKGSRPAEMAHSPCGVGQHPPAWDDDLQPAVTHAAPCATQPQSMAAAGFALFDSASSDPGLYSGPASKGDAPKTEQAQAQAVVSPDTSTEVILSTEAMGRSPSSACDPAVPATTTENGQYTWQRDAELGCNFDTAEESDSGTDAPGAMPAKSGGPARRARASRARAQAHRARAARVQQQLESGSIGSRQLARLGRGRAGNSSDSEDALGEGDTPYRRRSPQHPFWLHFLDPALEAAFVAWQVQQQFKADVLSAVLTVFVLLTELAHPSLEGSAFTLQACISGVAVGALYMVVMQRDRWQRSRELLASCLHGVVSGAILLFVFPAWAQALRGPKLRSPMWLFRFSGSEGSCAVPFIFMVRLASALRFRRALLNQALLLLASAAVSLPAVCSLPEAVKPQRLCLGLGLAMETAAFVLPLAAVHVLERRARSSFLQSPAALLPHAD